MAGSLRYADWSAFGERSGVVEVGSPSGHLVSVAASSPPQEPVASSVSASGSGSGTAAPEETLARAAVSTPEFTEWHGPRDDITGGRGVRQRSGLQTDGKIGTRIWQRDGTLAYDFTTAA